MKDKTTGTTITSLVMPTKLHHRFRVALATNKQTMTEILIQRIEKYCDETEKSA